MSAERSQRLDAIGFVWDARITGSPPPRREKPNVKIYDRKLKSSQPPRPGPEDPGPFSFASDIACGGGIEEALEAAMALGPTSRALQDQGPGNACRGCHIDPPRVATLSTR